MLWAAKPWDGRGYYSLLFLLPDLPLQWAQCPAGKVASRSCWPQGEPHQAPVETEESAFLPLHDPETVPFASLIFCSPSFMVFIESIAICKYLASLIISVLFWDINSVRTGTTYQYISCTQKVVSMEGLDTKKQNKKSHKTQTKTPSNSISYGHGNAD